MLEKPYDDATFESDPRFKRWVDASKGSIHYEVHMQHFIRGLGWLDAELIALDDMYYQRYWAVEFDNSWIQPEARRMNFKIAHLSAFWVIGGWEVVSTIHRRFNRRPGIKEQYSVEAFLIVKQTKDSFLEVRSRLAKFEPPGKGYSQKAGELVPYTQRGMRWQTEKGVVYRRDLADLLLDTVTLLATEMPHHKRPVIALRRVKPR